MLIMSHPFEEEITGDDDEQIANLPLKKHVDQDTSRMVYFSGAFNEAKACNIISHLLALDAVDPTRDIVMYIDSYGGVVDSFIAIHDAIKMLRCNLVTVCIGKAMSCAAMLLMTGTAGKRFITPNSRILLHQITTIHYGKTTDLVNEMKETKRQQKLLESMIIKYTKIKRADLKKILEYDSYFSAQQALKMGVVDCIIKHPDNLYSKINTVGNNNQIEQQITQIINNIKN